MKNKKIGNTFEQNFCELLYERGFWVHNLAQNAAGQPADVIAVRDGKAYLIDCKVCTNDKFSFSRIEENQRLAMDLWAESGNGEGWFALKFTDGIYMVRYDSMRICERIHSYFSKNRLHAYADTLEEWVVDA